MFAFRIAVSIPLSLKVHPDLPGRTRHSRELFQSARLSQKYSGKGANKFMKSSPRFAFFLVMLATSLPLLAQTPTTPDADKGFTEIETFQGTLNSTDKLMKVDSMAGYDFNKHFGVFAGLPIYFATASGGTTTGATGAMTSSSSNAGLGNFYLGLAF